MPLYKDTRLLAFPLGRTPAFRACDVALEAMLTIRDGSPQKAYRETQPQYPNAVGPSGSDRDEAMQKIRDRVIEKLKQQPATKKGM